MVNLMHIADMNVKGESLTESYVSSRGVNFEVRC